MEMKSQFLKQPGTYTATFEGGQLKSVPPRADLLLKWPTLPPSTYLVLDFKVQSGEMIGFRLLWDTKTNAPHHKGSAITKGLHDYLKMSLGLKPSDKFSTAKGKEVTITVEGNTKGEKTYMNITNITPHTGVNIVSPVVSTPQMQAVVNAVRDVFDV